MEPAARFPAVTANVDNTGVRLSRISEAWLSSFSPLFCGLFFAFFNLKWHTCPTVSTRRGITHSIHKKANWISNSNLKRKAFQNPLLVL